MVRESMIKKWVEDAIDKEYNKEDLYIILRKNNFSDQDIEKVLALYDSLVNERYKFLMNKFLHGEKDPLEEEVKKVAGILEKVRKEIAKVIIGQEETLNNLLCALISDGHVLIEGVPGIAKTLLIKSMAAISGGTSKRIQFTADLLPTDITGITTYDPQKGFEIYKGPIFANFVIADEINRSPPKTQSALLEAMQEKQVTIGRKKLPLPLPFFVVANNNPLEQSGVYNLPEAQVDRFLFKLLMKYPQYNDELVIMERNANLIKFEDYSLEKVLSLDDFLKMQELAKKIYLDDKIKEYILKIVTKTRTKDFEKGEYIDWGASPRASIALFIGAKARALMNGRTYVIPSDVKSVVFPVLRHRVILNYRAQAEGITSDEVIKEILGIISV